MQQSTQPQTPTLDQVIADTEKLIADNQPPDPAMQSVLAQLKALQSGASADTLAIGRTIMYGIEPAPNAEIQAWCDQVLAVWETEKSQK